MSCSKWAYIPERCDGDACPGDCDMCSKAKDGLSVKEAVKLLDELRQCYGWGDVIIHSDDAEALTMAIEALEAQKEDKL